MYGCSVAQSCLTLCDSKDCCRQALLSMFLFVVVFFFFQGRIVEWVAISSSRGPS